MRERRRFGRVGCGSWGCRRRRDPPRDRHRAGQAGDRRLQRPPAEGGRCRRPRDRLGGRQRRPQLRRAGRRSLHGRPGRKREVRHRRARPRHHRQPSGRSSQAGRRRRNRLGSRRAVARRRSKGRRLRRQRVGERGLPGGGHRHDHALVDAVAVEERVGRLARHLPSLLRRHLAHRVRRIAVAAAAPAAGGAGLEGGGGQFADPRAPLQEAAAIVAAVCQLLQFLADLRRAARPAALAAVGRLLRAVVATEQALELVLVFFRRRLAAEAVDAVADRLVELLLAIVAPLAERQRLARLPLLLVRLAAFGRLHHGLHRLVPHGLVGVAHRGQERRGHFGMLRRASHAREVLQRLLLLADLVLGRLRLRGGRDGRIRRGLGGGVRGNAEEIPERPAGCLGRAWGCRQPPGEQHRRAREDAAASHPGPRPEGHGPPGIGDHRARTSPRTRLSPRPCGGEIAPPPGRRPVARGLPASQGFDARERRGSDARGKDGLCGAEGSGRACPRDRMCRLFRPASRQVSWRAR